MKKILKYIIVVSCFVLLTGWSVRLNQKIDKVQWLLGTWENITKRGTIYETWTKVSDEKFIGKSYTIKEKDTIVFETITLLKQSDSLYYIPVVKNQNQGLPIRFLAKVITENQLVFENLKHDFPQIISYTKINSDSLVAEISGKRNGQVRKMTFPMKKIK